MKRLGMVSHEFMLQKFILVSFFLLLCIISGFYFANWKNITSNNMAVRVQSDLSWSEKQNKKSVSTDPELKDRIANEKNLILAYRERDWKKTASLKLQLNKNNMDLLATADPSPVKGSLHSDPYYRSLQSNNLIMTYISQHNDVFPEEESMPVTGIGFSIYIFQILFSMLFVLIFIFQVSIPSNAKFSHSINTDLLHPGLLPLADVLRMGALSLVIAVEYLALWAFCLILGTLGHGLGDWYYPYVINNVRIHATIPAWQLIGEMIILHLLVLLIIVVGTQMIANWSKNQNSTIFIVLGITLLTMYLPPMIGTLVPLMHFNPGTYYRSFDVVTYLSAYRYQNSAITINCGIRVLSATAVLLLSIVFMQNFAQERKWKKRLFL